MTFAQLVARACASATPVSMARAALLALATLLLAGGCGGRSHPPQAPAADTQATAADEARKQLEALSLQNQQYRHHLVAAAQESHAKDEQIAYLLGSIRHLQAQVDSLTASYEQQLSAERPRISREAALRIGRFAERRGEVAGFDIDRDVLVLRSDSAFQPGAEQLTREAASVLAALATLLEDPELGGVEIHVLVHSDSKPIEDDILARQLRREAWELSNRRALAIGQALSLAGVGIERLEVSGAGDRAPVASNLTAAGRAANRRVELWMTPASPGPMAPDRPAQAEADWHILD